MATGNPRWEIARPGAPAPTKRCYWVVEGHLLAGAYPESPAAHERGQRVEALWRAGIRTFLSLVEENERSPTGVQLTTCSKSDGCTASRARHDLSLG